MAHRLLVLRSPGPLEPSCRGRPPGLDPGTGRRRLHRVGVVRPPGWSTTPARAWPWINSLAGRAADAPPWEKRTAEAVLRREERDMTTTVVGLSSDHTLSTSGAPPLSTHLHRAVRLPATPSRPLPPLTRGPAPRRDRPVVRLRLRVVRRHRRVHPAVDDLVRRRAAVPRPRATPRLGRDLTGRVDTELGILKTGKEADAHLVERADPLDPDNGVVMVAKRYRGTDHRTFHRSALYTEGRSMKRSRDNRAVKAKSTWGRVMAAGQWVTRSGTRSSAAGRSACPSPTRSRSTAARSSWSGSPWTARPLHGWPRPGPTRRCSGVYFEQLREAVATMAQAGHRARRPVGVQHPGRG